LLKSGRIRID
jgi:tRNA(fMet)-specific endonuclease VapC